MIRKNTTEVWRKDALDVFLQMDNLFGKNHKSITIPISLYAIFNEHSDVLFHDATVKLRDVPISKNTDKMAGEYESILDMLTAECHPTSSGLVLSSSAVLISIHLLFAVSKSLEL